ncbi:3-oxoacyl-ACP reductase [Anaerobacillus arseniciselenatis]|uniref:3-oxoacyl-ACP reductase n=1 Tax=Anaerobacillus arseniciselenatis TaxID=85682 RepID=A0A1S2L6R0_9BACI|nr:SDR family oxidoreductase [Anaerobacillus arseniciselenatis]OIJ08172.1 3-oxoacyl-ACP reductase [Anaerobacillus arseniciselenatis]
MDLGLKGKSILILASSKGLGKAIAQQYAKEGARIMLSSRNEQLLIETAEEIQLSTKAEVHFTVCDIKNPDEIKKLVERTVSIFGTIDVLVNNCGGPPAGGFGQFVDDDWYDAFELTLLSYVRTIREVLPYMKQQQDGRIINITSSSIKQPIDNLTLSNTFRMGVAGLAKSLSQELAPDKILINTVGPGRVATDRLGELDRIKASKLGIDYNEVKQQSENSIPLGRYGEPDELAKTVVFLGSNANTYITGQMILVDGGMTKAL